MFPLLQCWNFHRLHSTLPHIQIPNWVSHLSVISLFYCGAHRSIGSVLSGNRLCWVRQVGFWKRRERLQPVRGGTMSAAAGAKKVGGALTRSVQVSPTLKKFLGVGECSRSESMKRVWDYIKDQKLQNPQNKKEVFCDMKLKPVLGGKDKVGFLEIAKHLSEHFPKAPKVPKTPKVPKSPVDPST